MHAPRRMVALAVAGSALLLAAPPALAHVTANPSEASKGGFAKVSFRVPNERGDASTVKVEIQLPPEHPIANVSTKPTPGWQATVQRGATPHPDHRRRRQPDHRLRLDDHVDGRADQPR